MPMSLVLALRTLLQNRLRASLTLSGMGVGVAMVVVVYGLGLGAQRQIETQIEVSGPTLITVRSGNFQPPAMLASIENNIGGGLTEGFAGEDEGFGDSSFEENAAMLAARQRALAPKMTKVRSPALPLRDAELTLLSSGIEGVRAAAASVSGNLTLDSDGDASVRIARVKGIQYSWPDMDGWRLLEGRLITEAEHTSSALLVVLTRAVADRLWPNESPLGKVFGIKGLRLETIGVVEIGSDDESGSIIVPEIFVPLTTATELLGTDTYDEISVRSVNVGKTSEVAASIKSNLRILREIPDDTLDDFRIQTQSLNALPALGTDPRLARAVYGNVEQFEQAAFEEMANSLRQAARTFTYLLSSAAAVCLTVGGIGIMNIMLVSVAARTREIGLRMALGARVHDVLTQFLVEALTLAFLGGILGFLVGVSVLYLAEVTFGWATAMSPFMLILAMATSATTGAIFGYFPARKAANLDPVVGLKME